MKPNAARLFLLKESTAHHPQLKNHTSSYQEATQSEYGFIDVMNNLAKRVGCVPSCLIAPNTTLYFRILGSDSQSKNISSR